MDVGILVENGWKYAFQERLDGGGMGMMVGRCIEPSK